MDYAALDGNVLKIIEAKARKSLSKKDIKNYVVPDDITGDLVFNADYATLHLGDDFLNSKYQKQFVLYLNGPNSQAIKNSLNLPTSVPYEYTNSATEETVTGVVEIIVLAVNK